MTMREQIGYAAEAIILRRCYEKRVDGYTLEMSREIAEAVLAALREPGDDVLKALADAAWYAFPKTAIGDVWKAAIDAAVTPTTKDGA